MFFHIIFLPSSLLLLFSFADTVYFTPGLLRGFFFSCALACVFLIILFLMLRLYFFRRFDWFSFL